MYINFLKPLLDLIISLFGILILSLVFVLVILVLFFVNNGKVFFIQDRPGKNGRIFKIIKFKTMSDARDEKGNLLPDAERLTFVGRIIRKASLDEMPQLINVLKGDMSLVGPRPLLPEYLPLYNSFQKRRHEVKPGITGWAQINGRNAITWQEKFELDVWYVENVSFWLDVKIIFLTIKKVLFSEGINAEGEATIIAFKGNE